MSTFWKVAPWISKLILLPPTAIFIMIAVQHLAKPAAMAAAEGCAFTSPVGPTVNKLPSNPFPFVGEWLAGVLAPVPTRRKPSARARLWVA